MPGGVIGPEGGKQLERLAGKGVEALKALAEKAKAVGEQGLTRLEETATGLLRDGRTAAEPGLRRAGAVPASDLVLHVSAQEVKPQELTQRLAHKLQTERGLTAEAARVEAQVAVAAAQRQLDVSAQAATEQLLGFSHLQGTTLPAREVLRRVQVRFADGLASGGKARFLTPKGEVIATEAIRKQYPSAGALYDAIVAGKIVPQVLVNAGAAGAADMSRQLTSQLLTHELTHVLFPAPYVGEALREGLTELTAATLAGKHGGKVRAAGYELEVAGAKALLQLHQAAFVGAGSSAEVTLGHLLTSPRAGDVLSGRLKMDHEAEELLRKALAAGDGKTLLLSLLQLHERLARQKKVPPFELEAAVRDLIDPAELVVVKRVLAPR